MWREQYKSSSAKNTTKELNVPSGVLLESAKNSFSIPSVRTKKKSSEDIINRLNSLGSNPIPGSNLFFTSKK